MPTLAIRTAKKATDQSRRLFSLPCTAGAGGCAGRVGAGGGLTRGPVGELANWPSLSV
jgi:hypothetical protein